MASALKVTSLTTLIRELHREAFQNGDKGPQSDSHNLSDRMARRYRRLAKELKTLTRWHFRSIVINTRVSKVIRYDLLCEHCLGTYPVALVCRGLISGSEQGDWVCAGCDRRVRKFLMPHLLMSLTGTDSI